MVRSSTPVGTETPESDASPSKKLLICGPIIQELSSRSIVIMGNADGSHMLKQHIRKSSTGLLARPFPNVDIVTLVNAMKRAFPRTDIAFIAKEIAFVVENRNLAAPTAVSSRRILKELRKRRRVLFHITARSVEFDRAEKAVRRLPGNSSYTLEVRRRR